jgi:hypothetical protein
MRRPELGGAHVDVEPELVVEVATDLVPGPAGEAEGAQHPSPDG